MVGEGVQAWTWPTKVVWSWRYVLVTATWADVDELSFLVEDGYRLKHFRGAVGGYLSCIELRSDFVCSCLQGRVIGDSLKDCGWEGSGQRYRSKKGLSCGELHRVVFVLSEVVLSKAERIKLQQQVFVVLVACVAV